MRRTLPSTGSLACFEAVFRHRSVTEAAKELNLTQSAVSRRLIALEELLGRPLFRRAQKKLIPEAAAILYGKDLGRILAEIETATTSFIAQGQGVGLLTVSAPPTFASRWLIPRLNDFIQKHRGIDINLVSKITQFDFDREAVDVAIHLGTPNWPGASLKLLMDDYVVPVCARNFLDSATIETPSDMLKLPLIQHTTRPLLWRNWCAAFGVETDKATVGPRFEFFSHVIGAATSGIGVALMSDFLVQKEIEAGELVQPIQARMKCDDAYYFVCPHRMENDFNAQTFAFWLQQQCNDFLTKTASPLRAAIGSATARNSP